MLSLHRATPESFSVPLRPDWESMLHGQSLVIRLSGVLALMLCVLPLQNAHAMAETGASVIGGAYVLKMILALVFVLGIFILLAKIARQLRVGDKADARILRVLTGLSLGARERLLIVQAGDVQLLLGVSPAGIIKLQEFKTNIVPTDSETPDNTFKDQLQKYLGADK